MLEMICAIPEEIGWTLVGVATTVTAIMLGYLVKDIYQAIKERLADDTTAHEM